MAEERPHHLGAVNTLMVTKFLPLPADSGGKQRSLAILKRLLGLGTVRLCAFREPGSDVAGLEHLGAEVASVPWRKGPRAVVQGLLQVPAISAARFWDPALARLVASPGRTFDHVQVEYTQLAPYGRHAPPAHMALDMHNVESTLAASFAATRGAGAAFPYRMEAAALRRLERRVTRRFDVVSVVSEADRARLGSTPAIVAPNGWEPTHDALPPASEPVAAFVALMGWPPNEDAAVWLARDIWPLVRAALPDARLLLVGRDPGPAVRDLGGGAGVQVTGTVDDVRPYLASARVALAPLRAAGGSRLKILEALDAGRPVVATTKGAEGLDDLAGEGVVIADEPTAFAAAVGSLLADPAEAARLGGRGRAAVAERHSWDAALTPLIAAIQAGVEQRRGDAGARP